MTETTASRTPSIVCARRVFARGVLGAVVALAVALAAALARADDCNGNGADDLGLGAEGSGFDVDGTITVVVPVERLGSAFDPGAVLKDFSVGSRVSPGLYESLELLGRETSLERLRRGQELAA